MVVHPQHSKLLEGVHVLHQPTPPENNNIRRVDVPCPCRSKSSREELLEGSYASGTPPDQYAPCATTILYTPTHHPHHRMRVVRVGGGKRHTKPVNVDSQRRSPNFKNLISCLENALWSLDRVLLTNQIPSVSLPFKCSLLSSHLRVDKAKSDLATSFLSLWFGTPFSLRHLNTNLSASDVVLL